MNLTDTPTNPTTTPNTSTNIKSEKPEKPEKTENNKIKNILFDVFISELNFAKLTNISQMVLLYKDRWDNILESKKIALFKIVDMIIGNQHQINNSVIHRNNELTIQNSLLISHINDLERRLMWCEHRLNTSPQFIQFMR